MNIQDLTIPGIRAKQKEVVNKFIPEMNLLLRLEPYKHKFPNLFQRTQDKCIALALEYGELNEALESKSRKHKQQ